MSFMKSLKGFADDLKELMGDKDKAKVKDSGNGDANRGASDSYHQPGHPQIGQQSFPPQQQHQYGGGLPGQQQQYGGPPASSEPNLPPGWVQQWDQNSQRNYYLEQATGRTQWDPPALSPPPMGGYGAPPPGQGYSGAPNASGYEQNRGYNQGQSYPQQNYGGFPSSNISHPGGPNFPTEAVQNGEKKKDKSDKKALLAAGAGGLVLGGIAGAALAGDDSDDEKHTSAAPASYGAPYGASAAGYGDSGYGYGTPPPNDSRALEHNSDVSSSQRSSLEEARHDYEEAQRKAADSDASSSDLEEAREARKEYQEEIEEAQEEAYDD